MFSLSPAPHRPKIHINSAYPRSKEGLETARLDYDGLLYKADILNEHRPLPSPRTPEVTPYANNGTQYEWKAFRFDDDTVAPDIYGELQTTSREDGVAVLVGLAQMIKPVITYLEAIPDLPDKIEIPHAQLTTGHPNPFSPK